MGVKGPTILNNAKKQNIPMLAGKQKNRYPIQLIPESFIKSLLSTYEVGEKVEIDGVAHVGVTRTQQVMGVHGETIIENVKKQ